MCLPVGLDAHVRRPVEGALDAPLDRAALLAGDQPRDRRARVGHRGELRREVVAELVASPHDADGDHVLEAVLAPVLQHRVGVAAVHRLEVGADLLLHRLAAGYPLALRLVA